MLVKAPQQNLLCLRCFEPVSLKVHKSEQYDAERGLTVGSIWFAGEFVGVFVLAGRSKDGGETWICNRPAFLQMIGHLMSYETTHFHNANEPIDEYVNGYKVE